MRWKSKPIGLRNWIAARIISVGIFLVQLLENSQAGPQQITQYRVSARTNLASSLSHFLHKFSKNMPTMLQPRVAFLFKRRNHHELTLVIDSVNTILITLEGSSHIFYNHFTDHTW